MLLKSAWKVTRNIYREDYRKVHILCHMEVEEMSLQSAHDTEEVFSTRTKQTRVVEESNYL